MPFWNNVCIISLYEFKKCTFKVSLFVFLLLSIISSLLLFNSEFSNKKLIFDIFSSSLIFQTYPSRIPNIYLLAALMLFRGIGKILF
ncbi:hypothetical protein GLOIN_2v1521908 [Rhizophagus irregularis DAOM 181602=DAOM 197198]|uniref:Uncharacterized protein n=1 Tax=Rhizophagus irregularis (strain DAOM 181602 / DAOM 197198 / MUCL 43194) TaxID=747089 RepID=A0A2P4QR70_RHIID|nr:hypothetical protein GLOIN_2v1521908 [Rhizophagus irregularis DAOM 181602=DAOM 197198]POG80144.1 hypothetical protein GLOIN_2v1521908 [Rhizophagus irregularis DAOM 181602=DAOM 197198]|eukprot:XP_025187010.1 hypothetical protein GLOIN_2v1521908 [Rhizophagus irregularis DAOM 181602=DAOM 197198]